MAADEESGKRRAWGPRAIGTLVPALVRPAFRDRSPVTTAVMTDWAAIVGPSLSAVTAPRRLSGTTLTIGCSGPVAMELQHMSRELLARINGRVGRIAVERLRFVQEAVAPPLAPSPRTPDGPAPVVEGIVDGPLHDALLRLGRAVQQAREAVGPRR